MAKSLKTVTLTAAAVKREVAALADPDRGWDAIVIGEYERAFYGSQYATMAPRPPAVRIPAR